MANPSWPSASINYRQVQDGVECTMKTYYDGVDLSVAVIRENVEKAEREAKAQLREKVRRRPKRGN